MDIHDTLSFAVWGILIKFFISRFFNKKQLDTFFAHYFQGKILSKQADKLFLATRDSIRNWRENQNNTATCEPESRFYNLFLHKQLILYKEYVVSMQKTAKWFAIICNTLFLKLFILKIGIKYNFTGLNNYIYPTIISFYTSNQILIDYIIIFLTLCYAIYLFILKRIVLVKKYSSECQKLINDIVIFIST